MRPVHRQRSALFNRPVKPDDKMIPNAGKPAFFMPFVNVGRVDVLPGTGRRAMDYDCINFIRFHRRFLFRVRVDDGPGPGRVRGPVSRPSPVQQWSYFRAST